jgi:hypothetical protein
MDPEILLLIKTRLLYWWSEMGLFLVIWLIIALLLVLVALKKFKNQTLKLIIFNLLLLLFLLSTVLNIGEAYYRFIYDYSDTLGVLQTSKRWLVKHAVYNADFFRDRNFTTAKNPGVTRIEVIGDSFSFGSGVEVKQRFSDILQAKLNRQNKGNFEVYNTSTPGWESRDELEYLKTKADMFKFDTVILSYFLNDIYKDRAFDLPFYNPTLMRVMENPQLKPIFAKSVFIETMAAKFLNVSNSVSFDINNREIKLYKDEKTWSNHTKTLQNIVDLTNQRNQKLIVVIFPYLDFVDQKPYPAEFIHLKIADFFQKQNVAVLDLYPILKNYPTEKLKASKYDIHPSPFVHEIVADKLLQVISPSKNSHF